jgi:uncharacterized metal-binding protein YceD (DUF177 family)
MKSLLPFSIPVKGLRPGVHEFDFQIDRRFFKAFEASPVNDGQVSVRLLFEKRPGLYVLSFHLEGMVKTECDRCLALIDLPISADQQLLVKFSEENEAEEADVVYINPEDSHLNVAQFIYEFIILALPMIKVYDCENDENPKCDWEMLKYLDGENQDQEASNPIWDALKDFQADN